MSDSMAAESGSGIASPCMSSQLQSEPKSEGDGVDVIDGGVGRRTMGEDLEVLGQGIWMGGFGGGGQLYSTVARPWGGGRRKDADGLRAGLHLNSRFNESHSACASYARAS